MSGKRNRWWWLLTFALIVRGGTLWRGQAELREDPDAYARLAANWSRTGVYGIDSPDGAVLPTAYRPPLYPWLLSWLAIETPSASGEPSLTHREGNNRPAPAIEHDGRANFIPSQFVAALHFFLGIGSVWLTYSIARSLHVAWPSVAALLVACDPILLRSSQLVMTETLATALVLLAWKLWLMVYPLRVSAPLSIIGNDYSSSTCDLTAPRTIGQWLALFALGTVLGLSILARPTAAPWVGLCLLGIGLRSGRCWKRRINDSLIVGSFVIACLSPWVLRNMATFGKPIWATTHGGYTLLLANNPLLYQHFAENGPSRDWDADPFHAHWAQRLDPATTSSPAEDSFWTAPMQHTVRQTLHLDELADDRIAYLAARETIERQPLMFGLSSLYRIGWLWAPWPNTGPTSARVAIGVWYACLFLTAGVGVWRIARRPGRAIQWQAWWLPLMLVASLTLIHSIYWSNMRMRAPASAVLAVAAAAAFTRQAKIE